jgi:hypothetical protein
MRHPRKVEDDSFKVDWEIFVSLLVRDGVNFLFIIVDFSVISLIKADIFSLFHCRAFPEKVVST